jgi:hypothetical protein
MSDLETLTSKLNEYGFGYRIESPKNLDTEANLVVIAKTSQKLLIYKLNETLYIFT